MILKRDKHFPPIGKVKVISSLTNPIVKDLRSLSMKKFRTQHGLFLAEGLKLIIDALDLDWRIHILVFTKENEDNHLVEQVAARCIAAGGLVLKVNQKIMSVITRRDNPQNMVGIFEQKYQLLATLKAQENDVFVVLDRVRDPGNLGTIIRTIDAAGAKGVILIGDTTDPFSMETVRATMGSIFSVSLYRTSEADFLVWRKNFSGLVIGTHLKGRIDYRTIPHTKKPVILLMGNEQQGLSSRLVSVCDKLAYIPQEGRADSLNLAVATGILLFEIRRSALSIHERPPQA